MLNKLFNKAGTCRGLDVRWRYMPPYRRVRTSSCNYPPEANRYNQEVLLWECMWGPCPEGYERVGRTWAINGGRMRVTQVFEKMAKKKPAKTRRAKR